LTPGRVPGRSATAVLLDVEGTTTPVDFVFKTLFPFARERALSFLAAHSTEPAVAGDVLGLRDEHARDAAAGNAPPPWRDDDPPAIAAYARWLMDQDRKATALKALQGRIWEEGFRTGALVGAVYPDVPVAFARWTEAGRTLAIFSSGSVLAQRLLFGHSTEGDLTPYLSGYFDTTTGPKREPSSYEAIATALGKAPKDVFFLSDVTAELDAAQRAGMDTALCLREGGPEAASGGHPVIRSFDEVP
jgi:enolase-phosphatase E1